MHWFRVYHDIIDDPKVLQLSAEIRWYNVGILAICSRQSSRNPQGYRSVSSDNPQEIPKDTDRYPPGILPKLADIATHLRLRKTKALRVIRTLIQAGLIDQQFNGSKEDTKLYVHGWSERQFKSDDVNARVRKHRAASICNVTVTPRVRERARSESETETETDPFGGCNGPIHPRDSRKLEVIALATQLWGADKSTHIVERLLRDYEVDLVTEAIDRHFDKVGKNLKPALLRGTCKGMLADGWEPEVIEPVIEPASTTKPREIIWGP